MRLPAAVEGVNVVVSAQGNDPHMFVPGRQNLIDAAERAGVGRLVLSDFSVDFFKFDAQENSNLALRKQADYYEVASTPLVRQILTPCYLNTIFKL